MVSILVDPSYSFSIWCTSMLQGLILCLKQKRLSFCRIDAPEQAPPDCRCVFVVGADDLWVRAALTEVNRMGMTPILLCNQAYHTFDCNYSTVCSDVPGSMRYLMRWLRENGWTRPMLYGINPLSISDQSRLDSFIASGGDPLGVFYNSGSMRNCYENLTASGSDFDAAICANCFVAISLVRRLRRDDPERLKRMKIIGYQEIHLTELFARDICTLRLNSLEYGKAAVMLMEDLQKDPYLSHIVMAVNWDLSELEGENPKPKAADPRAAKPLPTRRDVFYEDPELNEMMVLENLLYGSEEADREIVRGLLAGASYERIAEEGYMTVSTVKYRVKRMVGLCRLENRRQLLDLMKKYVPNGTET